jgi:hypothetical protein
MLRKQVSLSLTPDEAEKLAAASRKTGHTPTTLASVLLRYALGEYERVGSLESLLTASRSDLLDKQTETAKGVYEQHIRHLAKQRHRPKSA